MNKFNLIKENNQIKLIKYFYSKDTRGNFSKIFSEDFFYKIGFKKKIAQINISTNLKKGTIRGFHYQKKPKVFIGSSTTTECRSLVVAESGDM